MHNTQGLVHVKRKTLILPFIGGLAMRKGGKPSRVASTVDVAVLMSLKLFFLR